MLIVIAGNPIDGITFHGPFTDPDFATEWAEEVLTKSEPDWWVSEVKPV
jgi:hypothetical protein